MSQPGKHTGSAVAAGSPAHGEPVFIAVGKLRRPHGVKGELLMQVLTDFPERFKLRATLLTETEHRPLVLRSIRPHKDGLLVAFEGVHTPEQAGELRNVVLVAPVESSPPLPEGEYYHHQLIGLRVTTAAGGLLGQVNEIITTGASDVLVIRGEIGPEILIPLAEPFLGEIDLAQGVMVVHPIPGMLPGEGG